MSIPSSPFCDSCYNGESCADGDSGGCSGLNMCNPSCQTLCQVGYQLISKHPNVGDFPWKAVKGWATNPGNEDYLRDVLTAKNWNTLIEKLNSAEQVGEESSQGSGGIATPVESNQVFQALYYNEIQKKLNNFEDAYFDPVKKDDLVTAARINAIRNSFLQAKFKSSVCDICNTGLNECSCNCSCDCDCDCACECDCDCDCDCGCDCNCGCDCGNNTEST